jgi:hypothetical protein
MEMTVIEEKSESISNDIISHVSEPKMNFAAFMDELNNEDDAKKDESILDDDVESNVSNVD